MKLEDIARIEETLSIPLPDFYKAFLQEKDEDFFDTKLIYGPESFEQIKDLFFHNQASRIIQENTLLKSWNELDIQEEGFFSLGNDGHGNYFLIQLRQEKQKVFLLDHEEFNEDEEFEDNLKLVATNLKKYKTFVLQEAAKLNA